MIRRSSFGRAALIALAVVPIAAPVRAQSPQDLFENRVRPIGRTPVLETGSSGSAGRITNGRDHNPFGFSIWLAGGGVKGGITYGAGTVIHDIMA